MSWRAKNYRYKISRRRVLSLTLRRFKTAKTNRSQTYRQLIISCEIGPIREIALRLQKYKRPKRPALALIGLSLARANAPVPLLLVGLAGAIFFGQQALTRSTPSPKTFNIATKKLAEDIPAPKVIKPLPASVPTNISIPAVDINVGLMSVGQAADGTIKMPPILDWIAGWYKDGPTPGQVGPAIIVGHVDNYESIWVFWRLRYVQPGDDIFVTRSDGSTAHFKITALEQYGQNSFPTSIVYGNTNYPALRIITCGGTFSSVTESYNENTVVFATLVN
ncbi:MAG TPA: class F sortase [Candidatus Binatia bacterium]|nr:class F sortase [Candidatus Binatia bacterium]